MRSATLDGIRPPRKSRRDNRPLSARPVFQLRRLVENAISESRRVEICVRNALPPRYAPESRDSAALSHWRHGSRPGTAIGALTSRHSQSHKARISPSIAGHALGTISRALWQQSAPAGPAVMAQSRLLDHVLKHRIARRRGRIQLRGDILLTP